jgi:low temperature requirement protein LtrA
VPRQLLLSVARRAVPAGLVVAAVLADNSGSATAAFYAFLGLVLVSAVIALNAYGDLVENAPPKEEETPRRLQALLWAVLLALALLGAATRAPALGQGAVPGLASTAVIACLLLLTVEGIVELVLHVRRRPATTSPFRGETL